ncbi:hypothetical protein VNO77_39285 [Canavalia gladiata]|uniref:Uncharacterized protein n=1 Tax=Canavalia gladiata TaxID=3824 RepID=A0AAN9PX02_CANGL
MSVISSYRIMQIFYRLRMACFSVYQGHNYQSLTRNQFLLEFTKKVHNRLHYHLTKSDPNQESTNQMKDLELKYHSKQGANRVQLNS